MTIRHLYVHVPFCARRCAYCDFSIAVRKHIPAQEYVDCISRELEQVYARDPGSIGPLETLYLGGGTPSRLPASAVATLVEHVLSVTGSDPGTAEITLEANPDDVTPDAAETWRGAGVNRISLGAQSFHDPVLAWMHRTHDSAQIGRAMGMLREAGFANISVDLIFALPAELGRDWDRDLEAALALRPTHLSLYGLTVEPRTPLARWIDRGRTSGPDDERYAAEYLRAHERLGSAGYEFYEVSNAALSPELRSRHNSAYWSGRAYVGLGPSAHSFDGERRFWNTAAWESYRVLVMQGHSPIEAVEVLTSEQRELERVYLALRTVEGVSHPAVPALWEQQGWLVRQGDRVACTPEGWLRLDTLVGDLTGLVATS